MQITFCLSVVAWHEDYGHYVQFYTFTIVRVCFMVTKLINEQYTITNSQYINENLSSLVILCRIKTSKAVILLLKFTQCHLI